MGVDLALPSSPGFLLALLALVPAGCGQRPGAGRGPCWVSLRARYRSAFRQGLEGSCLSQQGLSLSEPTLCSPTSRLLAPVTLLLCAQLFSRLARGLALRVQGDWLATLEHPR